MNHNRVPFFLNSNAELRIVDRFSSRGKRLQLETAHFFFFKVTIRKPALSSMQTPYFGRYAGAQLESYIRGRSASDNRRSRAANSLNFIQQIRDPGPRSHFGWINAKRRKCPVKIKQQR
jgi:hypothetical protein